MYPYVINTNAGINSQEMGYLIGFKNIVVDKEDNIYLCYEFCVCKIDKEGNFINTYFLEYPQNSYHFKVENDKIIFGFHRSGYIRTYNMSGEVKNTIRYDLQNSEEYDQFENYFDKEKRSTVLSDGSKVKYTNWFGFGRVVDKTKNETLFKVPISIVIAKYIMAIGFVALWFSIKVLYDLCMNTLQIKNKRKII